MSGSNGKIRTFRDLHAWQVGHEYVLLIYRLTLSFPKDERFGLISQIRKSSGSITSNIAEGFGRRSASQKSWFYSVSMGSLYESQNQLIIARDLGYLREKDFQQCFQLSNRVARLLQGLINKMQSPN